MIESLVPAVYHAPFARQRAVVVRILGMVAITKRVPVTGHYINSHPSVQAWRAFCCEFPAFLLPMAQKLGCNGRILSRWSPWSAGARSYPVCLRVALLDSCFAVTGKLLKQKNSLRACRYKEDLPELPLGRSLEKA